MPIASIAAPATVEPGKISAVTTAGRKAAVAAGLLVCAASLYWMFEGKGSGERLVGNANVVGGAAGVVSLALVVVVFWPKRERAVSDGDTRSAVLGTLATETLRYWRTQAKVRRITTPSPAMVRWSWAGPDVAVSAEGLHESCVTSPVTTRRLLTSGVVTRLREQLYETGSAPRRLVILGDAGAGKTTAMLLLLIDVLEQRPADGDEPVPAWLNLGGWSPDTSLIDWAATSLARDYSGLTTDMAAALMRAGDIALFLDGLDEMPDHLRGVALRSIDGETTGMRVVVTSRPCEYRMAVGEHRLWGAGVIEVLPVGPAEAGDFLLAEQLGGQREAWQRFATHLRHHPDSVAGRALTTPLGLSLARDTYTRTDPAALLDVTAFPTPDLLLQHLLTRLLDLAYPDPAERAQATRWLTWIAGRLGTARDIRWWDIPAWLALEPDRLSRALRHGGDVTVALVAGSVAGHALGLLPGLTFGLVAWAVAGRAADREPRVLVMRWPDPARTSIVIAIGLVFGLTVGIRYGPLSGLVGGLMLGLMVGLRGWTRTLVVPVVPVPVASPLRSYRADRANTASVGVTAGVVFGLASGFASGLAGGAAFAAAAGIASGLAFGLVAGRGPALDLAMSELRLGGGRVRFLRLLETALERQLLRQAGAVYQFRHAALQDHLVAATREATRTERIGGERPEDVVGQRDGSPRLLSRRAARSISAVTARVRRSRARPGRTPSERSDAVVRPFRVVRDTTRLLLLTGWSRTRVMD